MKIKSIDNKKKYILKGDAFESAIIFPLRLQAINASAMGSCPKRYRLVFEDLSGKPKAFMVLN